MADPGLSPTAIWVLFDAGLRRLVHLRPTYHKSVTNLPEKSVIYRTLIKITPYFKELENRLKNGQLDEPCQEQGKFGRAQTFSPDLSTVSGDRFQFAKARARVRQDLRIAGGHRGGQGGVE